MTWKQKYSTKLTYTYLNYFQVLKGYNGSKLLFFFLLHDSLDKIVISLIASHRELALHSFFLNIGHSYYSHISLKKHIYKFFLTGYSDTHKTHAIFLSHLVIRPVMLLFDCYLFCFNFCKWWLMKLVAKLIQKISKEIKPRAEWKDQFIMSSSFVFRPRGASTVPWLLQSRTTTCGSTWDAIHCDSKPKTLTKQSRSSLSN